jgi:hypothetical protein
MKYAVGVLALLMLVSCTHTPPAYVSKVDSGGPATQAAAEPLGPLAAALRGEITAALQATEWPQLDPSIEAVINSSPVPTEVADCVGKAIPNAELCTWGSPTASTRVVIVGDSVAMTYLGPLRQLAGDLLQVHSEVMYGCNFVDDLIANAEQSLVDACPARKDHAIEVISATNPDFVIISNSYGEKHIAGSNADMSPAQWGESMKRITEKIRGSRIMFLSPPPADKQISDCYTRASTPADCISTVTRQWPTMADIEQDLAKSIDGIWMDSRPWFCQQLCPAFVGTTVTKNDRVHMSEAYGLKISPVIGESFRDAGVF